MERDVWRLMLDRAEQDWNALLPIEVTLNGMLTESKPAQPKNA